MTHAHTVQLIPGTVDLLVQEQAEYSAPDPLSSLTIPLIVALAGGGFFGHAIRGWLDSKKFSRQEAADMRRLIRQLDRRVRRLEHTDSRKGRIAHISLDMLMDVLKYIAERDDMRDRMDPDHSQTHWVPAIPPRLADLTTWVSAMRDELLALDDYSDDDDDD